MYNYVSAALLLVLAGCASAPREQQLPASWEQHQAQLAAMREASLPQVATLAERWAETLRAHADHEDEVLLPLLRALDGDDRRP